MQGIGLRWKSKCVNDSFNKSIASFLNRVLKSMKNSSVKAT